MGQAVATLANFEVNPSITVQTSQLVFVDELIRVVQDFDVNVFGLGHRSIQVEVLKINGAKAGTFLREDTVEEELEKLQQRCVCIYIFRIADAVATNGDLCAVRVILFWMDFTYNHGMAYCLPLVCWNVMVVDVKESVSTGYTLGAGDLPGADALAEMAKLIGIQSIPSGFVPRIALELAMLQHISGCWVKD